MLARRSAHTRVAVGLLRLAAVAVASSCVYAPVAAAQGAGFGNIPTGSPGSAVVGQAPATAQGGPPPKGRVPRAAAATTRPKAKHHRNGTRCSKLGTTRTCLTYRKNKLRKICVKKGRKKTRCHKPKKTRRSRARAADANRSEGYVSQAIPAVGKIWTLTTAGEYRADCSGTMVATNLVLTAAHCLWDNTGELVTQPDYIHPSDSMSFSPGSYVAGDNGTAFNSNSAPYGFYVAKSAGCPAMLRQQSAVARGERALRHRDPRASAPSLQRFESARARSDELVRAPPRRVRLEARARCRSLPSRSTSTVAAAASPSAWPGERRSRYQRPTASPTPPNDAA